MVFFWSLEIAKSALAQAEGKDEMATIWFPYPRKKNTTSCRLTDGTWHRMHTTNASTNTSCFSLEQCTQTGETKGELP